MLGIVTRADLTPRHVEDRVMHRRGAKNNVRSFEINDDHDLSTDRLRFDL